MTEAEVKRGPGRPRKVVKEAKRQKQKIIVVLGKILTLIFRTPLRFF